MRRYQINKRCTMVEIDSIEWLHLKVWAVAAVVGVVTGVLLAVAYPSFGDVQWLRLFNY